jgi:flagellar motor switch protein FliM
MEKTLHQEQVGDPAPVIGTTAADEASSSPIVEAWDLRRAGQIGREQLRSISQLHEMFARNLTHSMAAYLRVVFECALTSADHLTFREFLHNMPERTYLASCHLAPVDVTAVLQMDLAVACSILDIMLGGEGKCGEIRREITEIEEQVLESIMRIVCRELQAAWAPISLEFSFGQRLLPSSAQRLMVPDEKNLCLKFEIKMSEASGTLILAVPAVVSNALLRKISADCTYQRPHSPVAARAQIQKKLLACPFEIELCLPQLQLPLATLVGLKPGDVLSLGRNVNRPATLLVDESTLGMALPVRVNARRAARVVSLGPPNPQAGEL